MGPSDRGACQNILAPGKGKYSNNAAELKSPLTLNKHNKDQSITDTSKQTVNSYRQAQQ
jgi:hypothetical protein